MFSSTRHADGARGFVMRNTMLAALLGSALLPAQAAIITVGAGEPLRDNCTVTTIEAAILRAGENKRRGDNENTIYVTKWVAGQDFSGVRHNLNFEIKDLDIELIGGMVNCWGPATQRSHTAHGALRTRW